MSSGKKWRFCNKCEVKHPSPTGKKCKGNYSDIFTDLEAQFEESNNGHTFSAGAPPMLSLAVGSNSRTNAVDPGSMEKRLSRLEDMLSKVLLKEDDAKKRSCSVSPFSSDSEDDEISGIAASRKQKSKRRFRHARYLEEGETI